MNRRDFIKTALAGLAALVLPKGKAEEAPSMHVRFTEAKTAWSYIWPVKHKDTRELIEESRSWASSNGHTDPPSSTVTYADVRAMFDRNHKLQTHSLVKDIWVTDEWLEDWEAMGWKPERLQ